MRPVSEAFCARLAFALAGLVPVAAGGYGALYGTGLLGRAAEAGGDLDSHLRYLSGLLLGIGLAFWASIPRLEQHGRRIRLLGAIVVLGGLARLWGLRQGVPDLPMVLALGMELVVTPALCWWQWRLAAKH